MSQGAGGTKMRHPVDTSRPITGGGVGVKNFACEKKKKITMKIITFRTK